MLIGIATLVSGVIAFQMQLLQIQDLQVLRGQSTGCPLGAQNCEYGFCCDAISSGNVCTDVFNDGGNTWWSCPAAPGEDSWHLGTMSWGSSGADPTSVQFASWNAWGGIGQSAYINYTGTFTDAQNYYRGLCNVMCQTTCGNGQQDLGEDCDPGMQCFNLDLNMFTGEECGPSTAVPNSSQGWLCDISNDNGSGFEECRVFSEDPNCSDGCESLHCGNSVLEPSLGESCDHGAAGPPNNPAIPPGSCRTSAPQCTYCGDGDVDTLVEDCEDNNTSQLDRCFECKWTYCGDGEVQAPNGNGTGPPGGMEECDWGCGSSLSICAPDPQCNTDCTFTTCGDGVRQNPNGDGTGFNGGQEQCDGADDALCTATQGCNSNCECQELCGNGVQNPGETCDGTNFFVPNPDGNPCRSDCTFCGDNTRQNPEQCDDGLGNDPFGLCTTSCTDTFCGDDNIQTPNGTGAGGPPPGNGNEQCDDGTVLNQNDQKCLPNCVDNVCGDTNVLDGINPIDPRYEECDDGDLDNDDECTNTCEETSCGDGVIQSPNTAGDFEICEPSLNNCPTKEKCRTSDCDCIPECGDGVFDGWEECGDAGTPVCNGFCINCLCAGDNDLPNCPTGFQPLFFNLPSDPFYAENTIIRDQYLTSHDVKFRPGVNSASAAPRIGKVGPVRQGWQHNAAPPGFQDDLYAGGSPHSTSYFLYQQNRFTSVHAIFEKPISGVRVGLTDIDTHGIELIYLDGSSSFMTLNSQTITPATTGNGDGLLYEASYTNASPGIKRVVVRATSSAADYGLNYFCIGPPAPLCGNRQIDSGEDCEFDSECGPLQECSGCTCIDLCGNTRVDPPNETCDITAPAAPPNCRPPNTTDECTYCGDGDDTQVGEACDEGALNDPLGTCDLSCQLTFCGDDDIQTPNGDGSGANGGNEACDNGPLNGPLAECTTDCTFTFCGDDDVQMPNGDGSGFNSGNEECDEGTDDNSDTTPDACRTDCRNPWCGDSVNDSGESCDHAAPFGTSNNPATVSSGNGSCRTSGAFACTFCGDGSEESLLEECDRGAANADNGECTPLDCTLTFCGDGVIQAPNGKGINSGDPGFIETCEVGFDTCPAGRECINCTCVDICGNGNLDPSEGETCDNSVGVSNVGYESNCRAPGTTDECTFCGDGDDTQIGEECDDAALNNNSNGCTANCKIASCGDGHVRNGDLSPGDAGYEECDEGPLNDPLGICDTTCHWTFCGDSNIQNPNGKDNSDNQPGFTETCDEGASNSITGTCNPSCQPTFCGDDEIQSPNGEDPPINEQCDDAALNSDSNGCTADCQNASCGDGHVRNGDVSPGDAGYEECDDGTLNDPLGSCNLSCELTTCGDDDVQVMNGEGIAEECDDGPLNDDAGLCSTGCKITFCGDGITQAQNGQGTGGPLDDGVEECDGESNCTASCAWTICGDGNAEFGEECNEPERECPTEFHTCITETCKCDPPLCGNTELDTASETCDHAAPPLSADNPADPSGPGVCRPFGDPAHCTYCGDTMIQTEAGEECDNPGFIGCSDDCLEVTYCGDGTPQSPNDIGTGGPADDGFEECDRGEDNSDSTPDACRTNCVFAHCGDTVTDSNEECDLGDSLNSDTGACNLSCNLTFCGDDEVQTPNGKGLDDLEASAFNEECDEGVNNSDTGTCKADCTKTFCGDGIQQSPNGDDEAEACDDPAGNSDTTPDTCREDCSLPRCGDTVTDPGNDEDCDDGDALNSATGQCDLNCKDTFCGDGITQVQNGERTGGPLSDGAEECDGEANCDSNCTWIVLSSSSAQSSQSSQVSSLSSLSSSASSFGPSSAFSLSSQLSALSSSAGSFHSAAPSSASQGSASSSGPSSASSQTSTPTSSSLSSQFSALSSQFSVFPGHTICNSFDQCEAVPGSGTDECSQDADCVHTVCNSDICETVSGPGVSACGDSRQCITGHLECVSGVCLPVPGEGDNLCNSLMDCCIQDGSCPQDFHTECVGLQCVTLPGAGTDECSDEVDCAHPLQHTECDNRQCITVDGPGSNECIGDEQCRSMITHTVCDRGMCVPKPGPGTNECTTAAQCNPQSHLQCINNQCIAVPGSGTNSCSDHDDCSSTISQSHLECIGLQCVLIAGPGATECLNESDCLTLKEHTECKNRQCITVNGPGTNECINHSDCERIPDPGHLECRDEQCIPVDGAGSNECINDSDCIPRVTPHGECENGMCVQKTTPGSNECINDDDCAPSQSPAGNHLECHNSQCITVEGPGTNECINHSDCLGTPHTECQGGMCIVTTGLGTNECSNDDDCIRTIRGHTQCRNQQCITIDGSGPNHCINDSDCLLERNEYTVCADLQCILVPGSGENQCLNHDDCTIAVRSTAVGASIICGDGLVEYPEECDDGNNRDSDGCSSLCRLEVGVCGDGIIQRALGEQCEDILHSAHLAYRCENCRFLSRSCGDSTLDPGEECDRGKDNADSADSLCREDCSLQRCGDGILDSTEECDDGNTLNTDSCSDQCTIILKPAAPLEANITLPSAPPQSPNYQPLPYQIPLQRYTTPRAYGDTGPGAIAVIAIGSGLGYAYVRRRKKSER